jgi:hypothetical protein
MTVFAKGTKASYNDHVGVIEFICDTYVTLCICTFPNEKSRNVCILIYRSDFDKIRLTKESEK